MSELEARYKSLVDSLNEKQIECYHLCSIGNFIHHLNNLPNLSCQQDIYRRLQNYLSQYNFTEEIDIHTSMEIFNTHILPIGKVYEMHLHFSLKIKHWIFIGWLVMGNSFIYLCGSYTIVYAIYNLLIFAYYINGLVKYRKRAVYSFKF